MSAYWLSATANSAWVVLGVAILCVLMAVPAAWLVERTDLRGARALRTLLTFPYVVPSYLLAVAWINLANPDVGWINLALRYWSGPNTGAESGAGLNVYSLAGIIFIEATALYPILFLSFRASLGALDPAFEEAARLAGASPLRVLRSITLPLLRDGLVLALVAIVLASLASFGVPAMIGGPARIFVLTTGIYDLLKQGSPQAFRSAFYVALRLAGVAVAIVIFSRFFLGRTRGWSGAKAARPGVTELGAWRTPATVYLWALWLLTTALPLGALVFSSFQSDPTSLRPSTLNLHAWRYVFFSLKEFRDALVNSAVVASWAALTVVILSFAVALARWSGLSRRRPWLLFFSRACEQVAFIFYSLPGTVLALIILVGAARMGALGGPRIMDSLFILVFAYVLKYGSLGFNTALPGALQIHASLIESAQLAGAGPWTRLWRIWLPLLRLSLIAAGLLVLMPCLSELTMSILLYGPRTQTLGVVLFQLQEYADRPSAAVVGSILLLAAIALQSGLAILRNEKR